MTNLTFAAAVDIAAAIKAGDISSREITEHYIQRIEGLDSTINAMCVRAVRPGAGGGRSC
jgi:Asp-tRNA(Asn)/Glu-tRNA(Gln) amidotransferase A subunit family amidase